MYSRAERYLLDDVFSALDQNIVRLPPPQNLLRTLIASTIFQEALMFGTLFDRSQGLLAGKTVLLATNGGKSPSLRPRSLS